MTFSIKPYIVSYVRRFSSNLYVYPCFNPISFKFFFFKIIWQYYDPIIYVNFQDSTLYIYFSYISQIIDKKQFFYYINHLRYQLYKPIKFVPRNFNHLTKYIINMQKTQHNNIKYRLVNKHHTSEINLKSVISKLLKYRALHTLLQYY